MNLSIQEIKGRVSFQAVLEHYGHTGLPEGPGKPFTCLFPENHARGDQEPSGNFYTGKDGFPRFKCFSCGEDHDQISIVERWEGVNTGEAKKINASIGGIVEGGTFTIPPRILHPVKTIEQLKPIDLPSNLTKGTVEEYWKLANLRKVDVHGVDLAAEMGVLVFGMHRKHECWIVLDQSRFNAEARRLDGKVFTHSGKKVDTLKGSKKCWPVGIFPIHSDARLIRKIMVVEGSADLVAAYHLLVTSGNGDALPVAILGRGNGKIHPEALKRFEGKEVRIYPHADDDGKGMAAAERWGKQIEKAGAKSVTYFDFTGLTRRDGKPVNDLNDCTVICEKDKPALKELLP